MKAPKVLLKAVERGLTDPTYNPGAPIMANIVHLQQRDQWQFSVDIVKKPDGKLVAELTDARTSIWDPDVQPDERLNMLAKMLEQSAEGMRAMAQAVKA